MKIAFVAAMDPSRHLRLFSGIPYHLYWALSRQVETVPLGISVDGPPGWWRFYTRIWGKLTGVQTRWGMRPSVMKELAGKTAAAVSRFDVDVVLTVGQGYLVYWDSPLPIASFSDILYGSVPEDGFQEQVEVPRKLNQSQKQLMQEFAQRAVDKAEHIFVTSDFIVEGARRYGSSIPEEKVTVTQMGANLLEMPAATVDRRPPPPLKLLWMGTTWEGKGGPDALYVLDRLVEQGIEVEMNMVGRHPDNLSHPNVVCHGFLRKDVTEEKEQLLELYRQSHLLLLPTRKDSTPSGLAEAAAFNVPAVTTPVGGIPGMFDTDQVVLLPIAGYREEAPAAIINLLENGRLEKMAATVRHRFETALNWDVIAGKIVTKLAASLGL